MADSKISHTTIMFTDIVGYSAMINKDQNHALQLLETHDKIIEPIISNYKGTIIKKIGDAIFAEFSDPRSGIDTAIKIQSELKKRNAVSENKDIIQIRIGLHIGDMIRKDDDLFGHDVNLCSRIESIAPRGGIAASNALVNAINDNKISKREMGHIKLKNIIHPQQIFKIYIDNDEYESESEIELNRNLLDNGINIVDIDTFSVEETFSVAILYINNLGSDADESLAYNLTNEIISDCEYINELRTSNFNDILEFKKSDMSKTDIGRKLEVENVLQGSLLRDKDEIKLSFALININDGKVLWNEKWSTQIIDNKKIRKHIMQSIISKFNLEIPLPLQNYYSEEITLNSKALETYYKGKYSSDQLKSNDDLAEAKKNLQTAIDLDNQFIEAYSELGLVCHRLGQYDSAETNLNKALNIAEKKNDDQGFASIYNVMNIVNNSQGKYKKARENIEKALEIQINLNNKLKEAKFRTNYANCLNQLGEVELALEQNQKAISIKESLEEHKSLGVSYGVLANTYYATGDYSKALEFATKSVGVFRMNEMSNFEGRLLVIISDLHMLLGQYDKMTKYINEAEPIMKSFNESFLLGKLELMKSRKYLSDNDMDKSVEHIDNCIDLFEMAEQRPFLIEAFIEKMKILKEMNDLSKVKKIISKIEMLLNKLDDQQDRTIIIIIKMILNDEDIDNNIEDKIQSGLKADKLFSFWYLAQYYANNNNVDSMDKYHQNAIAIIKENSKKISNEDDKKTFLSNEYYNKRIQEKINVTKEEDIKEKEIAVFGFCPSCGFKNENKFAFCPSCGANLKQNV